MRFGDVESTSEIFQVSLRRSQFKSLDLTQAKSHPCAELSKISSILGPLVPPNSASTESDPSAQRHGYAIP